MAATCSRCGSYTHVDPKIEYSNASNMYVVRDVESCDYCHKTKTIRKRVLRAPVK